MFCCFLGKTLKRKQRVIPPEFVLSIWQGSSSALVKFTFEMGAYWNQKVVFSRIEATATQWLDWDQHWDFHLQDSHPNTWFGLEEYENAHTLTTTITGFKTHKKRPTPRSLLCWFLVLDEVKCKTHSETKLS